MEQRKEFFSEMLQSISAHKSSIIKYLERDFKPKRKIEVHAKTKQNYAHFLLKIAENKIKSKKGWCREWDSN